MTQTVADILKKKQEVENKKSVQKTDKIKVKKTKDNLSKTKPRKKPDKSKSIGLNNLKHEAVYQLFVEFIAIPREAREDLIGYTNSGDFAKKYKVSEVTLADWKKRPDFWDKVSQARRLFIKDSILGTALMALKRTIIRSGKAPEVKLAFQLADEFIFC